MICFQTFVVDVNNESLNAIQETVSSFIIATKSHEADESLCASDDFNDMLLFLAFDMSILSVTPSIYSIYCKQVREEYIHVEEAVYCSRRAAFLRQLLASGKSVLNGKLGPEAEVRVKINLEWECSHLESGSLVP
jgi:predicted metal-dependent HD superfamily phosphohydrolase